MKGFVRGIQKLIFSHKKKSAANATWETGCSHSHRYLEIIVFLFPNVAYQELEKYFFICV